MSEEITAFVRSLSPESIAALRDALNEAHCHDRFAPRPAYWSTMTDIEKKLVHIIQGALLSGLHHVGLRGSAEMFILPGIIDALIQAGVSFGEPVPRFRPELGSPSSLIEVIRSLTHGEEPTWSKDRGWALLVTLGPKKPKRASVALTLSHLMRLLDDQAPDGEIKW